MNKFGFRTVAILATAFVLMLTGAASALGAAVQTGKVYRITALGDSLAAGYEPGLTEKSAAYGYAERLYEQALYHSRAKLANYGILGLRTEGLSRLLQGAADGTPLKAADLQAFPTDTDARVTAMADRVGAKTGDLKKSLAEADLVVITVGGNDFSTILQQVLATTTTEQATQILDVDFLTLVNKYTESAEKTLRQVNSLAPRAQILITDQYLPLPKLLNPDKYDLLYEKAVAPITSAVDGLAAKLMGEGLPVGAVHIAASFKGKEGSMTHMKVSVFGDSSVKPDIHPTQDGYQAIAEAVSGAVWQEYRKAAAMPASVPFAVVIGGQPLKWSAKPALKSTTAFIDAGDAAKGLGAQLKWTAKTKTAVFRKNGRIVTLVAGATTMTVNGVKTKLPSPAYIQKVGKETKVYVPLAAVAVSLNYEIIYSQKLQTYFINP